ncbi:hypothetical protein [Halovenus halobia]|uniref:hypothetical protein n=1 Tax=Halovenus halobia TaxID=3396622 RepID=UPI003F545C47
MNIIVIAAGLVALFVFPMVAYGVMWFTSRDSTDRPEPPETNNPQRNIPGQNSGD